MMVAQGQQEMVPVTQGKPDLSTTISRLIIVSDVWNRNLWHY